MPWCWGSLPWPEPPWSHLFSRKRNFRSDRNSQVQLLPQVVSLAAGAWGPLCSGVMCPRSDPCNFRAAWVVRVTQWGPLHLAGRGSFGLLVFHILCAPHLLAWRGGQPGQWVHTAPGYHIFERDIFIHFWLWDLFTHFWLCWVFVVQAFSSCGAQGLLFVVGCGLPTAVASLVGSRSPRLMGPVAAVCGI